MTEAIAVTTDNHTLTTGNNALAEALTVTILNDFVQRPVLYRGQDAKLNQLTLTVANYSTHAVQVMAGGTSASLITMSFGRLLPIADAKAATITAPLGWNATFVSKDAYNTWELRPSANITLEPKASLVFKVSLPSVSSDVGAGNCEFEYLNFSDLDDNFVNVQMMVLKPPSPTPSPRLPISVGWMADMPAVVYVSPSGPSMIASSLGLTISNNAQDDNNQPAPLVTKPWGAMPPELLISFITIPRPSPTDPMPNPGLNAVTYDEYAQAFRLEVVSDKVNNWEIQAPTSSTSLTWRLKPKNPDVLGAGASVEVLIKNICTSLPPFVTALYVQYSGFPCYDDNYFKLQFQKSDPEPGVLSFYSESSNIEVGGSTRLSWSTLALDNLELTYVVDGKTIVKSFESGDFAYNQQDYVVTPMTTTTYTLTPYAHGQALPSRQITITVSQLEIDMYMSALTVAEGGAVMMSWDVTLSDVDSCILDPGNRRLPLSGSDLPLEVPTTTTFSITAFNKKMKPGRRVEQRVVTVVKPVIHSYKVSPLAGINAGSPVTVEWDTQFASKRTLIATPKSIKGNPVLTPLLDEAGSLVVNPVDSMNYQLSLDGFEGPVQQLYTVTLNPMTIDDLKLSKTTVEPNEKLVLSWAFTRATSFEIKSSVGETLKSETFKELTTRSESMEISADQDTTYTLTVTGADGPQTKSINLAVNSVKVRLWSFCTIDFVCYINYVTERATRVVLHSSHGGGSGKTFELPPAPQERNFPVEAYYSGSVRFVIQAWGPGHSPAEAEHTIYGPDYG